VLFAGRLYLSVTAFGFGAAFGFSNIDYFVGLFSVVGVDGVVDCPAILSGETLVDFVDFWLVLFDEITYEPL
jgi:hypothetical protein